MRKKRISFRQIAALVLALLFLAAAFALSMHDCDGDGCAVCAVLLFVLTALLPAVGVPLPAGSVKKHLPRAPLRAASTPVTGKTVIRC